eukprot:CFRG7807T1
MSSSNFGDMEILNTLGISNDDGLVVSMSQVKVVDEKTLVRDSWRNLGMVVVAEGENPLTSFVKLYFKILFRLLPPLSTMLNNEDTQSKYIGLLLSIVVNYDNSPPSKITKKKKALIKWCREMEVNLYVHVLGGRAMLQALTHMLPETLLTKSTKNAWLIEYSELVFHLLRYSEKTTTAPPFISRMVGLFEMDDEGFFRKMKTEYCFQISRRMYKSSYNKQVQSSADEKIVKKYSSLSNFTGRWSRISSSCVSDYSQESMGPHTANTASGRREVDGSVSGSSSSGGERECSRRTRRVSESGCMRECMLSTNMVSTSHGAGILSFRGSLSNGIEIDTAAENNKYSSVSFMSQLSSKMKSKVISKKSCPEI